MVCNDQTWDEVVQAKTVDEKLEMLQNMLLQKLDDFFATEEPNRY